MPTYILTITETAAVAGCENATTEHYRRRVELPDINAVIERMDTALKFKPRKPRSDKKPVTA